jgi:hypothetical protein
MALKERYEKSFDFFSQANDGGWQDWFNPEIPSELAFPSDTEFPSDVITEMLDQGETYWNHPGWIRDLWTLLEEWGLSGQLVRLRLTADWLLTTIPANPLDGEMRDRLQLLAEGSFCNVFEGKASLVYANREYYLKTLQWQMLPFVSDWLTEFGV